MAIRPLAYYLFDFQIYFTSFFLINCYKLLLQTHDGYNGILKKYCVMKFMNKGLTVPKWVQYFGQKYPKFIQPICQIGQKVWDIVKKRLHQASVVRGCKERKIATKIEILLQERKVAVGLPRFFSFIHAPL